MLFTLLASLQIRVNAVNPTVVMTPMGRTNWSDPHKAKAMLDRIPLGKFAGKLAGVQARTTPAALVRAGPGAWLWLEG